MSTIINGYWIKKREFWPSVMLAKLYAFRHHSIMSLVRIKVEEIRENESEPGPKMFEWQTKDYIEIQKAYQADPNFVEIQVFDRKQKYFIRWLDYMGGFSVEEMIEELMLPWTHDWYDGRVGEGTMNYQQADVMGDWLDADVHNGRYFYTPIISTRDPTNAYIYDLWPPIVKDLRRVGGLLMDGVEEAPIPVYVDYSKC